MSKTKEHVYNTKVAPLINEVVELCKQHDISMFAHFRFDLPVEEQEKQECCTHALTYNKEDYEAISPLVKWVGVE